VGESGSTKGTFQIDVYITGDESPGQNGETTFKNTVPGVNVIPLKQEGMVERDELINSIVEKTFRPRQSKPENSSRLHHEPEKFDGVINARKNDLCYGYRTEQTTQETMLN
jgi:hypothetical protein